jgi:hypothetical protein
MSRAAATELLDTLDPLAYPERMRQVAARARAADAGELAGLLDGLDQHGIYGQRLAVIAACAGQDTDYVAARLAHPDTVIRGHAQRAAVALSSAISDDALLAAVHDSPPAIRVELLRTIVLARRTGLADGLIDVVRSRWGDVDAARLLPGCGSKTVLRLLPELFHAVTAWQTLACRHPDALLAEAARQLEDLPPVLREDWWRRYGTGIARTASTRPRRVLDLLEQYREQGAFAPEITPYLPSLVAANPGRALRLLLAPEQAGILRDRGLPPAVLRRLVRAEPPELIDLGRAWSTYPTRFAELLRALPPSRRAIFHDIVSDDEGRAHAVLHEDVLAALPHSRREEEARRMARQARESGAHWTTVLAALAHLPDEAAREELAEATRRPAAEDRARAWPLLIRQAVYAASRGGQHESADDGDDDSAEQGTDTAAPDTAPVTAPVTALLADMERLRDEQDPVRSAALTALADMPPRLVKEDATGHLDNVATDAIRAHDSSPETRAALGRLAQSLLREHAADGEHGLVGWALRTIVRLSGNTGGADLGRLDHTLRRGQEHTVYEELRYWLEAGAENADHGLTFALARAVGRRASGMAELQELLWQAVQFGDEDTARTAVELWLSDPRTRDDRAAEVLALDVSAALLPAVSRTITMRRTDLLAPVLDGTAPRGRFLGTGSPRPLPPVGPCTDRWLPRQQRAAVQLLAYEVDRGSNPMDLRRSALAQLAYIPGEGARELRIWADDPVADEAELAEAALAALVRTDRPGEALPLLLHYTGNGRARTAVPALARAARYIAPLRLSEVLHALLLPEQAAPPAPAPQEQPQEVTQDVPPKAATVASRKEAVRLAATWLPIAEAAELLLGTYELPGQHEDVRAVCVSCAAGLLDDGRAWKLVESAAQGELAVRHAVLRVRPLDLPERHRERYARLITGLCDAEDQSIAEAVYSTLAQWAPWAPEAADVLTAAVTDLDNGTNWRKAAEGLVELVVTLPATVKSLEQVLTRLITADAVPDVPDAELDADRPARRRVEHIGLTLRNQALRRRAARLPAGQTGVLLAGHEEFIPLAVRVLSSAVSLDIDTDTLSRQFRGIAGLHAKRPGLAWRTADELRHSLRPTHRPGSREKLLTVARGLAADGGQAAGLLAVTLAVVVNPGGSGDWHEPWREFLRELRRHDDPDVRAAALDVTTASE